MKGIRSILLCSVLLAGLVPLVEESEASTGVSFFVGASSFQPVYYGGYGYYRPYRYYRPYYYRPYFYNPFYSPFYGYGFGYGYGYGYGYPHSYYYGYGSVRTEVKPQSTKVYVDGDYVGVTDDYDGWWQGLDLPPGRHRLVFRAPGYAPYVTDVRVLPGEDYHVKHQMQPGDDVIAELEMRLERRDDDRYSRRDHGERYSRPYRDYDRRDRDYYRDEDRDYYRDEDRDYYREEDRDRDYERDRDYPEDRDDWDRERHQQQRERGSAPSSRDERNPISVTLNVTPADATIYIDGTYYGSANVGGQGEFQVLLGAGVHRIEVVRPGYESYSQELHVQPNSPNRVTIQLQRKR